ncbi:MAG: hypothetical protein ABSG16_22020 [Candidatus Acidiferrum sp.]|jgi:type VI protein secretion system component Hcp
MSIQKKNVSRTRQTKKAASPRLKANPQELKGEAVTSLKTAANPSLFNACCNGKHIPTATVTVRS